jgi:hypothetical protein
MVDDLIFEEQLYVMYYEGINIDLSLIENDEIWDYLDDK